MTTRLASQICISGLFAWSCLAAELPVGSVTCSAPFQLDGVTVSNTATLFAWNRIGDSSGICTIRKTHAGTIWLQPRTAVMITPPGIELAHGTLRMAGESQLAIPSVAAFVQPGSPQTVLSARFLDGQWTLNPASGPAQLMGKHGEIYMRLDPGTLTTFSVSVTSTRPDQASGLDIQLVGCTWPETNNWFIGGEHIARKIELDAETIRKEHQNTWISGALEPLSADSGNLSAQIRVLAEKPTAGVCRAFSSVQGLNSSSLVSGVGGEVGAATIAGAAAAAIAAIAPGIVTASSSSLVPGTAQTTPSLP